MTRRLVRALGAGALAAAAVSVGLVGAARPAGALAPKPVFKVPSTGGTMSYPGLRATGQLELTINSQIADPTPSDCESAAYCDIVPIEVSTPPGEDPGDFASSQITFEIAFADGADLDVYAFAVGKDPDDPSSTDDTTVALGDSATGDNPEKIVHTKLKSELLIFNYSGYTPTYTVKVTPKFQKITKPTEKPDDTKAGGFGETTAPTFATTTTTAAPSATTTTTEPLIPSTTADPGGAAPGSFTRSNDAVDLSGKTRTSIEQVALSRDEAPVKVAGPASTASVLGVLVGVPVALLGMGFGVLRLRKGSRVKIPDLPPLDGELGAGPAHEALPAGSPFGGAPAGAPHTADTPDS